MQRAVGILLVREQRFDEGMLILLVVVRKNPADWVAWEYIGGTYGSIARILFQNNQEERAKEFLRKAINVFAREVWEGDREGATLMEVGRVKD
jgi:hypothetical protein